MPEVLAEFCASILRHALTGLAVYFVSHGYFTQSQADNYLAAAIAALLGLGWSYWQKYRARILFLTGLEAKAGTDPSDIEHIVAKGRGVSLSVIVLPLLLIAGFTTASCAGHASPKVLIDLTDRPAYTALKAFDTAEEQAYHAKAAWPTPAQHIAISQKFVAAYQVVIDVARIGVALPPGSKLTADDLVAVSQLTVLVSDFASMVGQPGVGTDVQHAFTQFNTEATKLLASVKGQ